MCSRLIRELDGVRGNGHDLVHAKCNARGRWQVSMTEHDALGAHFRDVLTRDRPYAYCDSCLALRLEVSLNEARHAALTLARSDGFMRKMRECGGCCRSLEITCLRS